MNDRDLRGRVDALENELDRRSTPSQRQAATAIRNDHREVDIDDRDDDELSASERQARRFETRSRRGGWIPEDGV